MKKIIVAGIPRSGTTYLYRSIAGLKPGKTSPNSNKGDVVKTHGLCPPDSSGDAREHLMKQWIQERPLVIFAYGDPIQSILSTILKRNEKNHFANCGYHGNATKNDLLTRDILGYEQMFDSWFGTTYSPRLLIKYPAIPKNLQQIESFLGKEIPWHKWKERNNQENLSKFTEDEVNKVRNTFKRLTDKINKAKDIYIFN